MDIASNLGVQSFCFRGFKDNAKVVALVKECGLSKIELCSVHADFSDESTFDDVIGTYAAAGVDIASIGVQHLSADEAAERKFFEFARKAGAPTMAVTFAIDATPEAYRVAEKLADEYDIYLAIHNHGGRDWLGSSAMLQQVMSQTSPRIGLCLDTA